MNNQNNNYFQSLMISDMREDDSGDLVQVISTEYNGEADNEELPSEIGILPVRNTVLFPGVIIPITVGRQKSIRLVKKAYKGDRTLGVIAQKNPKAEEPGSGDLYSVGTIAKIIKMLVLPDGNTTIIIQGQSRFNVTEFKKDEPYIIAKIEKLNEDFPKKNNKDFKAIVSSIRESANKILKLNPEIPQEAQVALDNIESPVFLTHFLSSNVNAEVKEKQLLLETDNGYKRATLLLEYMMRDIQMLELRQEIQNKVHTDIDQQQRDYYLRQQMKVLQDELGFDGPEKEVEELRVKGKSKKWSKEVEKHFNKELDKLSRINPAAAEFPVSMNYAELMVDLPWNDFTKDNFDLNRARKILDADHFGLEKVKDRIIEYLAVLKLKNDLKGPILCLYGPPGVGKTSLGKSIAKALNRKYIRMSLGGVHDEAEIRGHRKTYIGAMPGKVIQNIKKVKSSNPVFVLDEIDKVNSNFRGDPSSALLEVLDPEQNNAFTDNYLEVEYDLSKVLFIATANSLETIQPALRDRMEIIEITGYTLEEKVQIAKKHLIPKQRTEHGLTGKDITIDNKALVKIIDHYTRESGVRNLERKIGSVVRHIAKKKAMEMEFKSRILINDIPEILGSEIFDREIYENNLIPGVATGLAWTSVGGEILFIETNASRGKGNVTLSGQLGDVMKESAITALSWLRSRADVLNIDHRIFDQYLLHVHVPAGAVPKDGPSAGITILAALTSLLTQRSIKDKLAMTGEITLTGRVLPVGGIKEKILAAKRSGMKEILLCERNKRDVEEIGETYTKGLIFHYVKTADEVLELALEKEQIKKPFKFHLVEENKPSEKNA
ncbi:endopeptidase La [Fulvivirgaceae bacterium LMO-SS25]